MNQRRPYEPPAVRGPFLLPAVGSCAHGVTWCGGPHSLGPLCSDCARSSTLEPPPAPPAPPPVELLDLLEDEELPE